MLLCVAALLRPSFSFLVSAPCWCPSFSPPFSPPIVARFSALPRAAQPLIFAPCFALIFGALISLSALALHFVRVFFPPQFSPPLLPLIPLVSRFIFTLTFALHFHPSLSRLISLPSLWSQDMRASPYDLAAHGKLGPEGTVGKSGGKVGGLLLESWDPSPVRIETDQGRKEYQQAQWDLYHRSIPIRRSLLRHMDKLLEVWGV